MKVVILCGGKGTRLGEVTQNAIPKPMVEVGGIPIIHHIIEYYNSFGHTDFILCVGHLSWVIKSYFLSLRERFLDLTIDFANGQVNVHGNHSLPNWKVTIVETGASTMTAGRVGRALDYIGDDTDFMLTYGDGLADIDLNMLVDFHHKHDVGMTMTGVVSPGRFGELVTEGNRVIQWAEKPQPSDRYINGGFMVMKTDFARKYVAPFGDEIMLEREPFENAAKAGEMMLYKHNGYWQCMDTLRDWEILNNAWEKGNAPWRRLRG
jgi:glucose-1-phosphate cytidylyltransferase